MTIEQKRAARDTNRAAYNALTKLISNIVKEIGLDEEAMAKRIAAAETSEYGTVNGLINLIVAITKWPADAGDGSMVATNRQILRDKFNIDFMLMDDIKVTRGRHTFITDDLTKIDSVEPLYDDYNDYCTLLLEDLGVISTRATISPAQWAANEKTSRELAELKQQTLQMELENHKAWMASKA